MANIILNREKLKTFLLKLGKRKWSPISPFLFNIVLEFLSRTNKTGRRNKRNTNRKRSSQTIPICRRYDPIPKTQKHSTKKLLDTINIFSKVTGYTNNEQIEK
jgi:hypothetical protein